MFIFKIKLSSVQFFLFQDTAQSHIIYPLSHWYTAVPAVTGWSLNYRQCLQRTTLVMIYSS